MMTALLVARNILGRGPFDPWKVNTDAEYHEEREPDGTAGRAVPSALKGTHANPRTTAAKSKARTKR